MNNTAPDNLQKFRISYNKLDELLADKTGFPREFPFVQKLKKFVKTYPSFKWLKNEIRRIHDLRNLLVHEEKGKEELAVPTSYLLTRLDKIIDTIANPQTALDIATKEIFSCDLSDKIMDVLKVMADNIYSQVPVFENKESNLGFVGVFSETTLLHLIGGRFEKLVDCMKIKENSRMKEIADVIRKPINESWDFVAKHLDVYDVREMFHTKTFTDAALENSRLGVLFVTDNGKKHEPILGIITAWDLSKIDQYQREITKNL